MACLFCRSILECVDFDRVAEFKFKFEKGTPFKPFEQLMGVLPVASMTLIPVCYQVFVDVAHSLVIHLRA